MPLSSTAGVLLTIPADICVGSAVAKPRLDTAEFGEAVHKLAECRDHVSRSAQCRPFVGLFSFEHHGEAFLPLLGHLKEAAAGSTRRLTNCVSLGTSLFVRYWECVPEQPRR